MNRRSFLSAIVGLAASGAFLTSGQVVLAAEALSQTGEPSSKFITVLLKGRELVAMQQALQQPELSVQARALLQSASNDQFEELCAFLHANFDRLPEHAQVRKMLASSTAEKAFDFESDEQALVVAEELVPLAVLRELIRHHGVNLPTNNAPNFRLVAKRYVGLIGSRHPAVS